jgi:hypothetical protein
MQADPSWGRFHFCFWNGSTVGYQAAPEHFLGAGCELKMVSPILGYAVGGYTGPNRVAMWKFTGGAWAFLVSLNVGLSSGFHGIAILETPDPPPAPPGFFGQMPINADNSGLTVDGTPTALTDGSWYTWHDIDAQSLVDHLAAVITAAAASATVIAVVDDDGFLTLEGSAAFDVAGFAAFDLFGFASPSLSGGSSYTAVKRLEGSWFPQLFETNVFAPTSKQGKPRALVAQQQAADKTPYAESIGQLIFQSLTFEYITKAKSWDDDGARSSFTGFFETIRDGRKILFVPNWRGSDDYTIYHEYVWNLKDQPAPNVKRQAKTRATDLYWTIVFNLRGI